MNSLTITNGDGASVDTDEDGGMCGRRIQHRAFSKGGDCSDLPSGNHYLDAP